MNSKAALFTCPTCSAEYKVVRVEAPPTPHEGQLVCTSCGGPLRAREGRLHSNTSGSAGQSVTLCGHANGVKGDCH
jgi:transcription elongation factor Elf1